MWRPCVACCVPHSFGGLEGVVLVPVDPYCRPECAVAAAGNGDGETYGGTGRCGGRHAVVVVRVGGTGAGRGIVDIRGRAGGLEATDVVGCCCVRERGSAGSSGSVGERDLGEETLCVVVYSVE